MPLHFRSRERQAENRSPSAEQAMPPLLAAIDHAWQTMRSTQYSHRTHVDCQAGDYRFDCVLMVGYFLKRATPQANAEMRTRLKIRPGYVPSPRSLTRYFESLPPGGDSNWHRVVDINDVRPGDVVVIPPAVEGRPGHAVVIASQPTPLPNHGYAVLIYDSTAAPHGRSDTRRTDPRNQPLPSGKPSGLGRGYMEITVTDDQLVDRIRWSVAGRFTGLPIRIARPLD